MTADHVEARLSPSTVTVTTTNETAVLSTPDVKWIGVLNQTFSIHGVVEFSSFGLLAGKITVRVRQGQNTTTGTVVGTAEVFNNQSTVSFEQVDTSSYPNSGSSAYYTVTVQVAGATSDSTVSEATICAEGY